MAKGGRSGTLSILQAAAIDDTRVGASALRMLVALGTYADAEGWCWPKQRQLAARLGVSRQAVSKALRDLAAWGYIEIHEQYDEASGSQIASRYRLVMNVVPASQFRRTPQPDIAGGERSDCAPRNVGFTPPATLEIAPPATSDVAGYRDPLKGVSIERPNRTTQVNDPIDIPAESPERELFDYYRSKIQPKVRINAPEKIRARLKRFTLDELKQGIDKFAADSWWMENNATRGVAWFFDSDRRSEQFLNLRPRTAPQRNGSGQIPPGAASKQMSTWENFKGRHGGKIAGSGQTDGH